MIDRAPKVVSLPTDLHKDFVQMLLPLWRLPHSFRSTFTDLVRAMLAASLEPDAEEWAIHNYKGFTSARLLESLP